MAKAESTYSSWLHIEMRSCESHIGKSDGFFFSFLSTRARRTKRKREADPAGNKASVEVPMRDHDYVATAFPLFLPGAMVFTDLYVSAVRWSHQ